ncbi:DUF6134 family protein [Nitrincola tapanii]|uniref:DUF3108 domain-containing protein n=1 Tax=Nitrincola tapanii TaxID=1708751 RepID=A0A5A9W5H0_9GAMM|nr:DUF6134 family protein [Nitrincola tapanii]KAA0875694.1 hypothetical protein E1H14_03095 [Nitrincola tapanii]
MLAKIVKVVLGIGCLMIPLAWAEPTLHRAGLSMTAEEALALYGQEQNFEVWRNGRAIGTHQLRFSEENGLLRVDAHMRLHIRALAVFNYHYEYRATEWWQEGRLQRLSVEVNDDGKRESIQAQAEDQGLRVQKAQQQRWLSQDLLTTNHWNPGILEAQEVLNTLTGEASQLAVERLGMKRLQSTQGELEVQKYRLGAELEDTDTWYDAQGRWWGMEFSARDKSRIRVLPKGVEADNG